MRATANRSRAPRYGLGSSLHADRGVDLAQQMPAARLGSGPARVPALGTPSRDTIAVDGGTVRKKSAGLLSLVVAAGLGTTLGMPATTASAAPQVSKVSGDASPDTLLTCGAALAVVAGIPRVVPSPAATTRLNSPADFFRTVPPSTAIVSREGAPKQ